MDRNAYLKNVSIVDIDSENLEFQISFPTDNPSLELMISKTGIMCPVLLLPTKRYTVIHGFRRLRYALKIGKEHIPAYILDVPPQKALLVAIYDNLTRGLNIVEKAIAISKMFHFGFPIEEILNTMRLLELGKSEKILGACLKIAQEELETKSYFVEHSLSMKTIGYFLHFQVETKRRLISFLKGKKITESALREFLELALLSEIKFGEIPFHDFEVAETLEEAKTILKKRVSPTLSNLEQEFGKLYAKMALPPNAKIKVDPFFEKEGIEISIEAKKTDDINIALQKFQLALKRGDFDRLFEFTTGSIHRG